nr:MBL fold metallo-hydrolase [Kallipyga massiliensis]
MSEDKHWEKPNSYLLIGDDKAGLIDTGLGVGNLRKVVNQITDLDIVVLTTHVHWDHIGGHNLFDSFGVCKKEEAWINGNFPLSLDIVKKNLLAGECEFPKDFNIENYEIFQGVPNFTYGDGDVIDLGNRLIKVIHTPGHSPGHCCFYEEGKNLYTGDLVYAGKLDAYYPSTNPIDFLNSIIKIRELNFKRVLPGHYDFNLNRNIVDEIYTSLRKLDSQDILGQQHGIFRFENFSIHI